MLSEFLGLTRSLENPNLSLTDPDAWNDAFGGSRSSAGVNVTHKNALSLAPVWQAVSMISGDIAKQPLDLFRRIDAKSREKAIGVPASNVVRRRSNAEVTAKKFWRRFMVHSLLWNNAYAFIDRNGRGEPIGLINLLPDRTYPERKSGQLRFVTVVDGKPTPLLASDVIHVEGITTDNMSGCDLVSHATDSWGLALAAEGFGSEFFANGAQAGGVLEIPPHYTKKAADNLEAGWYKKYEGKGNWFKTAILREGAKFHNVTVDAQKSQHHELREDQVREVARWFNLSPSRLGLSDSVSYNSKSEDNQAYLDSTIQIWLDLIADECWAKLLTTAEQQSHFFEHNTKSLLRMNAKARMEVYETGLEWGVWSVNEVRSFENMNPRDGGNVYYSPMNHNTTGEDAPAIPVEDDIGGSSEVSEDEDRTLHDVRRLLFNIGQRGRHKAKKPTAFCEWVDGGLAWHREQFRATFGDNPDVESLVFDALCNELNEALNRTQADELSSVAGEILKKHEQRAEFITQELKESD
jgi:HK97 family phage portal protein